MLMHRQKILKYWGLIVLLFVSSLVFSQSKEELERKKQQTQKEINYTNKLLKETKNNRASSYNRLLLIKKKIQLRKELITNIKSEQLKLEQDIKEDNNVIESLETDLRNIKKEYEEMIRFAYRHRNKNDIIMFIFSSESFNQAYKRMKYVQQYSQYRKEQASAIRSTQEQLNKKIKELESQKLQLDVLIRQHTEESVTLETEQNNQSKIVESLKSEEKNLMQKLRAYQKEKEKIQKSIARMIREEARKARERARAKAKAKNRGEKYEDTITPEQRLISKQFGGNKGRLPWPVSRGVVTYKFGVHPHPVLKHVKEKKNGIGISTTKGTMARAIFEGKVINILPLTGKNNAVMLKHGEYITVYVNIREVIVSVGQKVSAKEELGTIYTNPDDQKTTLELQIWKGTKIQNPILWISKD